MAKKMVCKAAPEIEISIDGGDESVLLRFDVACLASLQELEGGMKALFKMNIPEQAARLMYAAGKDHNENFTLEDARKMVSCMDVSSVLEIINVFSESVGSEVDKTVPNEYIKKMMAQLLR